MTVKGLYICVLVLGLLAAPWSEARVSACKSAMGTEGATALALRGRAPKLTFVGAEPIHALTVELAIRTLHAGALKHFDPPESLTVYFGEDTGFSLHRFMLKISIERFEAMRQKNIPVEAIIAHEYFHAVLAVYFARLSPAWKRVIEGILSPDGPQPSPEDIVLQKKLDALSDPYQELLCDLASAIKLNRPAVMEEIVAEVGSMNASSRSFAGPVEDALWTSELAWEMLSPSRRYVWGRHFDGKIDLDARARKLRSLADAVSEEILRRHEEGDRPISPKDINLRLFEAADRVLK